MSISIIEQLGFGSSGKTSNCLIGIPGADGIKVIPGASMF